MKLYFQLFPKQLVKTLASVNMHTVATDEKELVYWLKILGGEKAMTELLADSGGGSVIDCHQEAHNAGRLAYALFGANVFKDATSACHSGYYHGAMEAFLKDKGTDDLGKKITELCGYFSTAFGRFECLHGVGHGVMAYDEYDLPKALNTCDQLGSQYEQSSCYGGVFMENIIVAEGKGATRAHKTDWVSDDPHFPCNAFSDANYSVRLQCYLIQTARMLDISHYDFNFVTKECLNAPDDMKAVCFQSLGRDAAGQTLRDPAKIFAICNRVPSAYFDKCLEGSLYVIVEFWGEQMTDQPHGLCKIVPAGKKQFCWQLLAGRLKEIFPDENARELRCSFFEHEYLETCRKIADVSA